ncbi:hypothetical protein [Rhizobium sp. WW_1]|jgi:hypothetical protein|uniref:hypothetical protein n=1 Tax=Rhizobium sp. WW_1 TaxID=1907375 RepID=UPI000645F66D|nr:hypothetical protein [Rhizobium sp. WW_1]
MAPKSRPPAKSTDQDENNENGHQSGGHFLAINNLHYHANELSELRKLAEVSPELAEKVIEQRDKESARITASYNFGIACSIILLALILASFTILCIYVGIIATIAATGGILAVALMIRVILTGEWSETSWVGKIVASIIKGLGGST